jgi:hypothetical protein
MAKFEAALEFLMSLTGEIWIAVLMCFLLPQLICQ